MSHYQAPVGDMQFILFDVFKAHEQWQSSPALAATIDSETASAIIEESAKITGTSIAPNSRQADEHGVKYDDGVVTTPPSYKESYSVIAEGGWTGLTGNADFGGMGMPKVLGVMFDEMLCSADLAFSLYVSLTSAAALTISRHGSDTLKDTYLPKMYSGEWAGTMCLTESHAGTDLGMMHTKATPNDDGSYNISGTKIFITAGEHDLTEQIVHLVLAKLPDAPPGSRGISLFLVPKFHVDAQGNLGERNSLSCGSVEHKMGISASATCVMNFDDAKGYMIGEPNKGLACMFTMMNYERLSMGSQGLGCSERSYQNALAYAKDRLQGRGADFNGEKVADPIIVHADVRRMLLNMKSLTEAGRAFNTYVGLQLDLAEYSEDKTDRQRYNAIAQLLTPIAKAFVTDMGLDICVLGQQVFGGHGFIREWGQEQLVRDVRISQIYEGTNGIQALDLIGRKVIGDKGLTANALFDEIQSFIDGITTDDKAREFAERLQEALALTSSLTAELIDKSVTNPNEAGAASVEYLHVMGYVLYGYMWLRILEAAAQKDADFYQSKLNTASFYFSRVLPRIHSLHTTLSAGADVLYLHDVDGF
jgi:alkylation response protein AidB-like acyl-CoA dehydrogenase